MKKYKNTLGTAIYFILNLACGMCVGFLVGRSISDSQSFIYTLFLLVFSFVIATFIHESGHLVFGLVTGYRFSSFRLGSFIVLKSEGGLKLKRFRLPGTLGQCLLEPPELIDGKIPVVLYNLGGVLMNLIAAGVFYLPGKFSSDSFVGDFCLFLCALNRIFAVTNGVPRSASVANDGANLIILLKDPFRVKCFWSQMKVNRAQMLGTRLADMPRDWFVNPGREQLENPLSAACAMIYCNRALDSGDVERTMELADPLLNEDSGILPLHRRLLENDMLFCRLVKGEEPEFPAGNTKKLLKSLEKTPSVMRTRYAVALLYEKDRGKAGKILAEFDSLAKTWAYSSDIESERRLISLADEAAEKQTQ